MTFSSPIPSDAPDQAVTAIWRDVTDSLTVGDIEKLHDAIKDFISLSASDKKTLEDMASILPFPGLPPTLITQIFTNPEATVGIIERLGSDLSKNQLVAQLGTSEQAIVLDALIAWLKSEQKLSSILKVDASKADTTTNTATNPLNTALQNYIASGGTASTPLHMGSLQFLKNNAISLAGLNIADPSLLNQAYQMASQQLLITLLPEMNTSNLSTEAVGATRAPTTIDTTSELSRSNTIQRRLVDDIRKALQDGAIPLNMQTYLVLWTAITLPAVQAPQQANEKAVKATSNTDSELITDTDTATGAGAATIAGPSSVSSLHGMVSATGILPLSPIVSSVLTAIPALFNDRSLEATPALTDQLGMLSYIYAQMAPYWSGPAAVSLMAATKGGEMTEQKKLESSVRAFAIALGALLNDPSFDKLLAALLKKAAPTMSEEQLQVFIAAMKVSILTNALVALYIVLMRKTQGQFRADELAQLILGPPLDDRIDLDDLQKGLIKSIQTELRFIPPEKHAAFVNNLLSAYNQDTDINSLVDPTKQFLNLCDSTLNLDKASNTKG